MVSPIYLYGGFLSHAGTPIETPIYGILHMGNMNDIRWDARRKDGLNHQKWSCLWGSWGIWGISYNQLKMTWVLKW